jgi:excinuclease ABC subunit B
MDFQLVSEFKPTGDQPQAIKQLVEGINTSEKYQTLLGVTGSGKTFSVANVVAEVNRPTLVLAHNKTLAAQLYSEFKQFFPNNAVEYFVSYYDYYQPEAYIPVTGTYIEKDLSINDEIERLRISTSSSLLSGRRDVLVVASVSCLYGIGNPIEFKKNVIQIEVGQQISRTKFLHQLVTSLYARTEVEIKSGTFKVKGDVVTIYPSYGENGYKVHFFGDEIEEIESFDLESNKIVVERSLSVSH